MTEKSNLPPAQPAEPKKAREEPKRGGGLPRPKRELANVAPHPGDGLPKGLVPLLRELDTNGDGKVGLSEWRGGAADFREQDLNGDGAVTPEELLRDVKGPPELKFRNGRAVYVGEVEERQELYQGKKAFKVLTVRLEAGKTYQIDLTSRMFQAFLYLEGPGGNRLKEHSSPTIGGNSRITYRAEKSGAYRVVATSLGGFRTGPFACLVSVVSTTSGDGLPRGLASVLRELDKDEDGQIGLYEWRGSAADFREYDLNCDGFITPKELLRYLKR